MLHSASLTHTYTHTYRYIHTHNFPLTLPLSIALFYSLYYIQSFISSPPLPLIPSHYFCSQYPPKNLHLHYLFLHDCLWVGNKQDKQSSLYGHPIKSKCSSLYGRPIKSKLCGSPWLAKSTKFIAFGVNLKQSTNTVNGSQTPSNEPFTWNKDRL